MSARTFVGHSRLAGWSSYLAALSIPVLIIAAVGHRAGLLDATPTYGTIAVGFLLATLAVFAALAAFVTIGRDGTRGVGTAIRSDDGPHFLEDSRAYLLRGEASEE